MKPVLLKKCQTQKNLDRRTLAHDNHKRYKDVKSDKINRIDRIFKGIIVLFQSYHKVMGPDSIHPAPCGGLIVSKNKPAYFYFR